MLRIIIKHIEGNPSYSPWGEKPRGETSTILGREGQTVQAGKYRLHIGEGLRVSPVRITKAQILEALGKLPDVADTAKIVDWVQIDDKLLYIEGWSDECIAGWNYPKRADEDAYETFFEVGERLTLKTLLRKQKPSDNPFHKRFKLLEGGWLGTPNAKKLFGITYGIYTSEKAEGHSRAVPMTGEASRAGQCYELAWRHVVYYNEGTLVHGEVWSHKLGRMIGHAWVLTVPGFVYEPVSNMYFDKDELYKAYKMREIDFYMPTEARKMVLETGNFGPWTQEETRKVLTLKALLPSTLKPFVKVGERVRFIGSSRSRYGRWPEGKWLEHGVTGTVSEYHPESPAVTVGGELFEAIPPYAVVRWDLGGESDTCIDSEDEGKRWERIRR